MDFRHLVPRLLAGAALVSVLCFSLFLYLACVYAGGIEGTVAGFSYSSRNLFRPALAIFVSWLALAKLFPTLGSLRDAATVLACFLAYSMSARWEVASGDVVPTDYTALSIASLEGTSLDAYPELLANGVPYYLIETPVGLRSRFPLGPALVAWPLFVPAASSNLPRAQLVHRIGRFSALLIALASVWLVLRIGQRLSSPLSPRQIALAYGLATSHWAISSTALWQHGPGELWILGALERFLDETTSQARRLLAMGACLALAVFTRPPLLIAAAVVAVMVFHHFGKRSLAAILGFGGLIAAPLVFFHLQTYGALGGPYVVGPQNFDFRLIGWVERTFWLFASASRGVFWFEPVVLLVLLGAGIAVVRGQVHGYLRWGLVGYTAILAFYGSWVFWWGGDCYGPRYMTDALPFWVLMASSLGRGYGGAGFRTAMAGSVALGVLVNVAGIVGPAIHWSARPPVDWFSERLTSFGDSQLVSGLLSVTPGDNRLRRAVRAEQQGDLFHAGDLWMEEWRERPWHQFAAFRAADFYLRTDRWKEALDLSKALKRRWPDSAYARHLHARLPRIYQLSRAKADTIPVTTYASRNLSHAINIRDARFGTNWSTIEHQKAGDWLELIPAPEVRIRGLVLFSAPDFAAGPASFEILGRVSNGDEISLGRQPTVFAASKGWIALRFEPGRFEALRIRICRDEPRPWTVSEARFLLAQRDWKVARESGRPGH
ncbi:MAG TPA: hypothetical protein VLK65_29655 [Vicinamibacteria bacterium]|nr:hypothetical protein [Vicinamibacteria bacterium]